MVSTSLLSAFSSAFFWVSHFCFRVTTWKQEARQREAQTTAETAETQTESDNKEGEHDRRSGQAAKPAGRQSADKEK